MAYPELLGNGKKPTQLTLDGTMPVLLLAVLVIGKPLATTACLAGGAIGGLLTPSLATGALLGELAGVGWSQLWPGAPVASDAIVGAAAVLATTQRAPLCAIVLALEFTHSGYDLMCRSCWRWPAHRRHRLEPCEMAGNASEVRPTSKAPVRPTSKAPVTWQ